MLTLVPADSEEEEDVQARAEAQDNIRSAQLAKGEAQRNLDQAKKEVDRIVLAGERAEAQYAIVTEDAAINLEESEAQALLTEAEFNKTTLNAQINALGDLLYEVDDEATKEEIRDQIGNLNEDLVEAEATIVEQMDAFNLIADRKLTNNDLRIAAAAQAQKDEELRLAQQELDEMTA